MEQVWPTVYMLEKVPKEPMSRFSVTYEFTLH